MRKLSLTVILLLCILTLSEAQDYKTGIGFRGGFSQGLTLKHFINSKNAIEGLLLTRWSGFGITGLYEIHNEAFDVPTLKWYYGFGAHIGFWNGDYVSWGTPGNSYSVFGLDGIIGIEYSFNEAPINIGLDWKPAVNLFGYPGFWADGGAISIRYIF